MGSPRVTSANQVFPAEMAFKRTWRTYQSRLLDRLDSYLDNGRLHVVAAPGSGKTIFGLEVIRRINQPTLVLAPTITIRNQWVERVVQHFLPADAKPDWISTDLRKPELFTVSTYQALHAICSGEMEREGESNGEEENGSAIDAESNAKENGTSVVEIELPASLSNFKTLVVDEAHHLKAEWWKALTFVAERITPTIVALTATPPYDVPPREWERYEQLCGPIDAEIAIPELVLEGDLCPHQDYVYFSAPGVREQNTLDEFRRAVDRFAAHLRENSEFARAIAAHPFVSDPDNNLEEILDDPEYLSSMAIYLHAVGVEMSPRVLQSLGLESKRIPALNLEWLEILLTHCLYADAERFASIEFLLKDTRRELLQIGAIERRKVVLRSPSDHTKLLTSSITKLHSIEEIVRLESGALNDKLRCVVLTDYIRKSELPKSPDEIAAFEDIGVVPIFETLRRANIAGIRLGVLSGSLIIVPAPSEALLRQTARELGIGSEDLTLTPLANAPDYFSVELRGHHHQGPVHLITSILEKGGITVLVGTKSLLGEGWDAPTINTLILASFVGSYVLSNQMRGRSIRTDPASPTKTANIWHLVCVEPGLFGPGDDYEVLERRCKTFVGVSALSATIQSGIERLGFGRPPYTREQIAKFNAETFRRALDREGLRRKWQEALTAAPLKQMTDELRAKPEALLRDFVLSNTIAALLVQAGFVFIAIFFELLRNPVRLRSAHDALLYFSIIFAVSAAVSLPWALMAVWRFIRHGTPERSMRQIGLAVLESLEYEGSIAHDPRGFRVYANHNQDGSVYCWMGGGSGRNQAIYLRTLREVLRPVENPRYLLARKRILRFFREDYFAVPEVLARKKEYAEMFAKKFRRHVWPVELIYTRTGEGRKTLLRARMHSLSASFQKQADRVSCWR